VAAEGLLRPPSTHVRRIWAAACVLALMVQVLAIAWNWRFYQYDFRAYYFGPQLARTDQDPYSERAMLDACRAAGLADNTHSFLYPPHMLVAFAPVSWLPFRAAYFAWLLLEVSALLLVARATLRNGPTLSGLTVLALGFNGSLAASLRAGQVGLVTAALVAVGVELWQRERADGFVAAVTAAALPKFWPGALLVWGAIQRRRTALFACASGCAILLLVNGLDHWLWPEYSRSFSAAARSLASWGAASGPQNGSLMNFCFSLMGAGGSSAWLLWLLLAVAVAGATMAAIWRSGVSNLAVSSAACLLGLLLLLPRVMIYEWCIAMPSMALVMSRCLSARARLLVLGLSLFPGLYLRRYLFHVDIAVPAFGFRALWTFTNLWTVTALWAAAVRHLTRAVEPAPASVVVSV